MVCSDCVAGVSAKRAGMTLRHGLFLACTKLVLHAVIEAELLRSQLALDALDTSALQDFWALRHQQPVSGCVLRLAPG